MERHGGADPDAVGLFAGLFDTGSTRTGGEAWLQAMLDSEAALARALERAGLAPEGAGAAVTVAAVAGRFDLAELGREAAKIGNPVSALARALRALVPAEMAGAVHRGATSQDILDTAAILLAKRALRSTEADLGTAADAAATLAEAHIGTIMIGRTLLQQAVPVTFGLVAAGWLTSLDEARAGLAEVMSKRLAVQFGGAAGTLSALGNDGPRVAVLLADELGLAVPVLPWHTDRLRIVQLSAALAGAGAALGKIARDVTLLAQSEVAEVSEGGEGGEGRGGSSAMPQKRNPVAAVLILGCTRRVPGLLATLAASAEQEYQRAAGAWHAEWEPLADLLRLTGSAASWGAELLSGLQVHADRMRSNLDAADGFPMAEPVAALLAPALGPEEAHDLIAAASRRAVAAGQSLGDALTSAETAQTLADVGISPRQVKAALDPVGYLGSAAAFTNAALAAHQAVLDRDARRA